MSLTRSDFLYELPEELVAQTPAEKRDESRLITLDRTNGSVSHKTFHNIVDMIHEGDVLVVNDTRVIPARLFGKRPTGGQVELLLLEEKREGIWDCLAKPARRLRVGEKVLFEGNRYAEVLEVGEDGHRTVAFHPVDSFFDWLEETGKIPLPPYIHREAEQEDRIRYQTVFAKHNGAVAAPTAGLHFTEKLMDELRAKGVEIANVTLHVGIGTFRPVTVENLEEHQMHYERYSVTEETAEQLNNIHKNGGRIIAVGTTSVRTLETVTDENGIIHAGAGSTNIFIKPPYSYKAVDALITNFHLPGSTLMMLVSALAGRENILSAYKEAVEQRYRLFSYGDAMFIH